MVNINYENIVTKVRAKIDATSVTDSSDLRYVPVDKAINFDLGEYPAGLRNKGYTVRLAEQQVSKFEDDDDRFRLQLEIQFTLNGKSDEYLSQLGNCVNAIASLESLRDSDFTEYRGSDIFEHIWESFPLGELIVITFSEIYFEIEG